MQNWLNGVVDASAGCVHQLAYNALIDATQPNQKAMKTDKTTTSSPDSTDADVTGRAAKLNDL